MAILAGDFAAYKQTILVLSTFAIATTSLLLFTILRLAQILPPPASASASASASTKPNPPTTPPRPPPSAANPTHLLIVLGSGGHTAEMLNILTSLPSLTNQFTRRTYLLSTGDSFSAGKAHDFEKTYQTSEEGSSYSIATVRRARRVHQSFLSTPLTALLSLWDCIAVLRGTYADVVDKDTPHLYPDLILTNGPGTGVCVVLAALLLRFFGACGPTAGSGRRGAAYDGQGQMRTVFVESWARVRTLSLSGRILRPLVNRFLVQWPQLAETLGEGVEYMGPLVS